MKPNVLRPKRGAFQGKRPRVAQDRPQDVLDPPKPAPNEAQDPPQIRFYGYFWMFGSQSKFA